jgi:hypothetical protein
MVVAARLLALRVVESPRILAGANAAGQSPALQVAGLAAYGGRDSWRSVLWNRRGSSRVLTQRLANC